MAMRAVGGDALVQRLEQVVATVDVAYGVVQLHPILFTRMCIGSTLDFTTTMRSF
jgi:hypothetical protein